MEEENEFVKYIENKQGAVPHGGMEFALNETLLSLYDKGFINVVMEEGEPMIAVSEKGHESFLAEFASSMMKPIEA
jgi:hypothetical protein